MMEKTLVPGSFLLPTVVFGKSVKKGRAAKAWVHVHAQLQAEARTKSATIITKLLRDLTIVSSHFRRM